MRSLVLAWLVALCAMQQPATAARAQLAAPRDAIAALDTAHHHDADLRAQHGHGRVVSAAPSAVVALAAPPFAFVPPPRRALAASRPAIAQLSSHVIVGGSARGPPVARA